MTIFMVQKAKVSGFDGWYNLKAFTILENAEKYMEEEKKKLFSVHFEFCINSYKLD
jgi:hypothetical protein